MSRKPVKRRLGRFAFAATIFVAGVIAFASWSYYEHRNNLLQNLDDSLSNAVFAAREIVGDDYAQSLLLVGNTNSTDYTRCRKQLTRFAQNGGLTALGAAGKNETTTCSLVAGTGTDQIVGPNDIALGDPLAGPLAEAVLELAAASDEHGLALLTTDHPEYGMLRGAIFYKGHSDGTGLAFIAVKRMADTQAMLNVLATRTAASGILLLVLAVPLVVLYNRSQQRAAEELARLNDRLKQRVEVQQDHEVELKDAISDLERFTAVSTGRESRIIELKSEVNELLAGMNRKKRYNIDKAD